MDSESLSFHGAHALGEFSAPEAVMSAIRVARAAAPSGK